MKVVILSGGKGTRLREETEFRPKPMVQIGSRPILWHIMKIYAHYGFKDFVICLGYKGNMIKEYFLNYEMMNNDFTIQLGKPKKIDVHGNNEEDWNVSLIDTGEETLTGSRVKRIEKYIDDDTFMLTYGDGLANINIEDLLKFHKSHGKIGTVTGVQRSSQFGEITIEGDHIIEFNEKPDTTEGFVSGGFFVFNKEFFNYLKLDENCILEREPLENLAKDNELMVYRNRGFWQCVDTYRELELMNNLWNSDPPWKIWK